MIRTRDAPKHRTIHSFSKAAKVLSLNPDMPFIGLTTALRRNEHASEDQSVGLVDPSKANWTWHSQPQCHLVVVCLVHMAKEKQKDADFASGLR